MGQNEPQKKNDNLIPHMTNKNKAAVALGRRGGKAKNAKLTKEERKEATAKARAKLAEVRAAKSNYAMLPKIHTLKKPCAFPGCKITNGHEHINV